MTPAASLRALALIVVFALPACAAGHPPPSAQAVPGLEKEVRAELGPAAGYQQVGDILRGVAPEEDTLLHWSVTLERGNCYLFSAVGDQTVYELKIYIFNPNGERVFSRRRPWKSSVIGHFCVTAEIGIPGAYRVEVKPTQGYGHVRVGVFLAPLGSYAEWSALP